MYVRAIRFYILLSSLLFLSILVSCSERNTPTENNGNNEPPVKQTWAEKKNPGKGLINKIISDTNDNLFLGTDSAGVFKSDDGGDTWESFNNGLPDKQIICLAFDSTGFIFAGTSNLGIFRSPILNDQWIHPDTLNTTVWSFITLENDAILSGSSAGVLKSDDNGNSWSLITVPGLQQPFLSFGINSSGRIYGGTFGHGVLFSDDQGSNWQNTSLTALSVLALAVDSEGTIFIGTLSSGALRSSDNGVTWGKMENGILADYITDIELNSSQDIYIATYGYGIYRSFNGGDSWQTFNEGLTDLIVTSITFDSQDFLVAATESGKVFRTTLTTDNN